MKIVTENRRKESVAVLQPTRCGTFRQIQELDAERTSNKQPVTDGLHRELNDTTVLLSCWL
jgi:hypothetical protein